MKFGVPRLRGSAPSAERGTETPGDINLKQPGSATHGAARIPNWSAGLRPGTFPSTSELAGQETGAPLGWDISGEDARAT